MKVIKEGPLGPKNYPPVLKSSWHDDMLVRFIDQHLEDQEDTLAQVIVHNAKLWYSLTISNSTHKLMRIKVPM